MYMDQYLRSLEEPEEFWGEIGERVVHWDKPFEKVLDNTNPPFTKWYSGGYLNACYNAIDRHVLAGRGDKVALIHDSPMTNTVRHVTYQELQDVVSKFSGHCFYIEMASICLHLGIQTCWWTTKIGCYKRR